MIQIGGKGIDQGLNFDTFIASEAATFGTKGFAEDMAGEVLEGIDRIYNPSDISHFHSSVKHMLSGEDGILEEAEAMRAKFTSRIKDFAEQRAAAGLDDIGSSAAAKKMASSGGIAGAVGKAAAPIAIGVAALWAASAVVRPPRIDQQPQNGEEAFDPSLAERISVGAPAGAGPTARLVPKVLRPSYNINIKANSFNDLTNEQMAGIIEGEIYRQTSMNVNLNLDSRDSRESLNRSWFEQKISSFL